MTAEEKTGQTEIREETGGGARKKSGRVFWKLLAVWCLFLAAVSAAALMWFYHFLGDYQRVYEQTRPALYLEELMEKFRARDVGWLLEQAVPVELGPYEGEEELAAFLEDYLAGKDMDYGTKAGEYIEERPVYVVTADKAPFAVVQLKKRTAVADYGLPLWETDRIELLPLPAPEYRLLVPSTVEVTVNGRPVTRKSLEESGIQGDAERYLQEYVSIPTYNRYNLGKCYQEPEISGVNAAGEAVEVTYDSKKGCYVAGFGSDEALRESVEEYVIQVVTDYALYLCNDLAPNALDKYFPWRSQLLAGIKRSPIEYFADHRNMEVKNQRMSDFTVYSEYAFSARVYLEQSMLVLYSGKTETLVTDVELYFVKLNNSWKVAGIAFE